MNEKKVHLSVIIPAYNEAQRIEATLRSVDAYLRVQQYSYEIIVVDNGSNDNTRDIVKKLKETLDNLRVVEAHERGKGGAVKFGMLHEAKGEFAMFMDADNATPISEIEKFWPHLQNEFAVVIGSRYLAESNVTHRQPLYRVILSRVSNLLIQLLAAPGIRDTQLGFKVFTASAAKEIFSRVTIWGWGFDMEVLTIANIRNFKIKEVPVLWREQGGSHVPLSAYLQSLRDLLKIKFQSIRGIYKK